MGLRHRKLIPEICQQICHVGVPCSSDCNFCFKVCLTNPQYSFYPPPPPPPLPVPPIYLDGDEHERKHLKISTFLSFTLALLVAIFFVFCCREIYTRFWNRSRRRGSSSRQQTEDTRDDFLDEEHGPVMVDHPIWYIRTPGLQQSIIRAITVCKYKKGEGLIEGTECSVCLSEFQEDENLRLLPKCRHAFHLPCIDTWLRSHTNCPMCRAPIVVNPARVPSFEPNSVNSSSLGNTHVEIVENRGETSDGNGMENSGPELRNRSEEECQLEVENGTGTRGCETESSAAEVVSIQPRRSVSLDSSSAAKINLALATVLSVESEGNSNGSLRDANEPIVSKRVTGNEDLRAAAKGSSSFRTRYLQSVPSSMKKSSSYNGVHLLSWYSRSQKKPNAPLRSF